jgi:hypothetical protein
MLVHRLLLLKKLLRMLMILPLKKMKQLLKVDPTLHVAETAEMAVKKDTTAEEVIFQKDEFCPNKSFETKSTSTISYSAPVAPPRKLGGFEYYSLKYDSDSE